MYSEGFASKLKHARQKTGFTQRDVEAETGIKQSLLARYETGKIEPSIETLGTLADFYGIDLNWLVGTKGENELYKPKKERLVNNDQMVGIPRTRKPRYAIHNSVKKS